MKAPIFLEAALAKETLYQHCIKIRLIFRSITTELYDWPNQTS